MSRFPVASRFAVAVAAGLPVVLGQAAPALAGTATYQNGSATSSWSLAGNWTTADGTALPPNAATAAADFSTLDLSAAAAVTLDGTFTANSLKFGDAGGIVFGWTLSPGTATPTPTLTLAGTTPGIQVVNSTDTATIGAVLAGTAGLAKTGAGVLVLNAANTYTGTTTVNSGVLQVGDGTSGTTAARLGSAVSVASGATLDLYRVNGGTATTSAYTLPTVTLQDGGKLRFRTSLGTVTHSTSAAIVVAGPAATIENNGGGYANDLNLAGPVTGSGTLNYVLSTNAGSSVNASRTLTLSSANSAFSGNWSVDDTVTSTDDFATLRAGAANALGTGTVTLNRRAVLVNGVAGGINSLSGVTVAQPTASFDAGPGWAAPTATLTLTAGSAKVGTSPTSFGTISVGTLNQADGSIALDLGASAGDKVVVGGAYGYTGTTGAINVAVVAAPAAGSTIPIVAYGTLSGTPLVNVTGLSSRQTATVNYGSGTNDAISLTINGSAANLVWTGANGSAWDVNTTQNFTNVGTGQPDVFLSLDHVTFDDTGTVTSPTLASTVTPTSVTFNNSVNTYTLGGAGGIGGAATVAKTGTGTVILTNPNTYTGTTTVTGGTLQVGGGGTTGSLGTGTTTIGPAGTVSYFRADTTALAIATPFAGAGTLTFQGTGTINQSAYSLTGDNSGLSGTVSIQPGARVQASNADAPHFGTATVAVASGGTAYLTGGTFANPFTIAGAGWTETAGNLGAIRLGGGTVSGPVTLAADAMISAYGSTGTIGGAIGEAGGARKLTLGTGTSGTITLSGTNTYTGGTEILRTAVVANSSGAFGAGPVTISSPSGTAARITLGAGATIPNPLTINATDPLAGRGILEGPTTGTATWAGPITVTAGAFNGGTFYTGGGTLVLTGGITSSVGITHRAGNLVVSGGGSYPSFSVTGNLKIGANNGLDPTTTLNLGVSASADFDLNGFSQTVAGLIRTANTTNVTNTSATAGTFTLNVPAATPTSYTGNVVGNLSLVKAGDGTATLSGTGGYTGTTTISGGTLQIGAAGTTGGIGTGAVTNNAALVVNRSNAVTLANAIGGTGSLTNAGTGVLTLGGASTYTGPTTVSAGGLVVAGSLGATNVTVADGASVGGKGSIAAGGSLTIGTGSGATLAADASTAGGLAVGGNLTAVGTTTVSLAPGPFLAPGTPYPVVTYGGTFTGSTANFALANASSFRSATFANTGSAITLDVGSAALTWTGANGTPWDLNATQNFKVGATPATFFAGDAVTFDDSAATGTVALTGTIAPSAVVVNNAAVAYSFANGGSGVLAGSTSLVKRGAGVLTVGGLANTYTGGTTIAGGEVRVSGAGALGTGAVTLGDATTGANPVSLYIDTPTARTALANQVIVSSLATGTVTLGSLATSATTGDNNNFANIVLQRDVTFDSNANDRTDYRNITGTGNITITGTNRTILSGTANANAFVGNVTIATTAPNGSVQLGVVSGALNLIPDASNVAVNPGAVLRLSTTAEAINALTGGGTINTNSATATLTVGSANGSGEFSGVMANGAAANPLSFTKTGTGVEVLSGISTYTGATTVNNGRLSITGTLGATATTVGSTVAGLTPTLGGTGTVGGLVTLKSPGTSATFLSAGHLAPGNSVGTLTVASLTVEAGSVLDYEFNATANDLTVVTAANGLSLLGGGVNLYAEGTTSAYAFPTSGTYHLLQYTGTDPSLAGLSVLNPRGDTAYAFQLGTDGTNKYVDLAVGVPEPASAALLAMAGAGLLSRRRRRA